MRGLGPCDGTLYDPNPNPSPNPHPNPHPNPGPNPHPNPHQVEALLQALLVAGPATRRDSITSRYAESTLVPEARP